MSNFSANTDILRTPMGIHVLKDDTCLSRWIERDRRLDLNANILQVAGVASLIPEGGIVVNAGASLGDHAVIYSQIVGAAGRVYCFEPHPVTFQALSLNVARLNNVGVSSLALSDAPGKRRLVLDPNIGASYLSDGGTAPVEVETLDDHLLPHLGRCHFLHLDAEGWEPRILKGATKLIEKFHPSMIVEVCDKHLKRAGSSEIELLNLLASYGYRVSDIGPTVEPELRDVLAVWT